MRTNDDDKKKRRLKSHGHEVEEETGEGSRSGESGQGGQSGQIAFRDFTASTQHIREDMLPDEIKRLLSTHDNLVEANVKKQKNKKDQYKALKEKKVSLAAHRQGLGNSANSQYRSHPVLNNKAQFSGVDRQVNALPNENVADTNEANRNELENQYRLRYAPGMQPTFNPKPQYR